MCLSARRDGPWWSRPQLPAGIRILIRAVETAEIVLRGREIPIITDVRLEEMGFGICEGTTDFQDNPDNPIYPLFAAPETYRIPVEGGESLEDLYARTGAFFCVSVG